MNIHRTKDRTTTIAATATRGPVVIAGILLFPVALGFYRAKIALRRLLEPLTST